MKHYVIAKHNHHLAKGLGGKADNLFYLQKHGLPVPEFICLSAQAFNDNLAPVREQINAQLSRCDYDSYPALSECTQRIKALIASCPLLPELQQALDEQVANMAKWPRFSVRSSAHNEDGATTSFAGQLSTFLHVSSEQVAERVKECWASAFEPGVLTYHRKMGLDPAQNPVCVIVQRMVDAQSAGVMFQADPQGDIKQQVIAAAYGLGEGVVADKVESDIYRWHSRTDKWQLQINEKTRRIVASSEAETGTVIEALPEALQQQAVLTEDQREALLARSHTIASLYSHYQDIEWAFDQKGTLYILQARPITTIPRGSLRAFDASNIAESYPGAILPMTFAILQRDYHACMRGTLANLGIPDSLLSKREQEFRHLVAYIEGRAYYNSNSWYRIFMLSPVFRSRIIQYFEEMIGSEGTLHEDLQVNEVSLFEKITLAFNFPLCFIKNLLSHERNIRRYFKQAGELERRFRNADLPKQSSDQLIGYLDDYTRRFADLLKLPLMNDFFTMIFMHLTRDMFIKTGVSNARELLNRLLANQEVESAKPVASMQALSNSVRESTALRDCLQALLDTASTSEAYPLKSLASIQRDLNDKGFEVFARQFAQHIERYGHRSPKELIMETNTFRENPSQLLRIILESARLPPLKAPQHDCPEEELDHQLRHNRWQKPLRWLLKKTRQAIAHREATRLDRGLHFAFFRSLLQALGERLVTEQFLKAPRDVFYLTLEELEDFRHGCAIDQDLKTLVDCRKTQHQRWLKKDPQEQVFTRGTVYGNPIQDRTAAFVADDAEQDGLLQGVGCSQGQVQGHAAVVTDPSAAGDVTGKILVSESTDPGWVFLMTLSAGLISERGSPLSHTAIIGRELGIPTVVGVKNATRLISDGDTLHIDGESGRVRNLSHSPINKPESE